MLIFDARKKTQPCSVFSVSLFTALDLHVHEVRQPMLLHLLLAAGVLRPPRAPPSAAVRLSAEPISTATPTPRAAVRLSAEPISAANTTEATGVLAGLAGSTAAAVTTAGGVCVGGACAVRAAWVCVRRCMHVHGAQVRTLATEKVA